MDSVENVGSSMNTHLRVGIDYQFADLGSVSLGQNTDLASF